MSTVILCSNGIAQGSSHSDILFAQRKVAEHSTLSGLPHSFTVAVMERRMEKCPDTQGAGCGISACSRPERTETAPTARRESSPHTESRWLLGSFASWLRSNVPLFHLMWEIVLQQERKSREPDFGSGSASPTSREQTFWIFAVFQQGILDQTSLLPCSFPRGGRLLPVHLHQPSK